MERGNVLKACNNSSCRYWVGAFIGSVGYKNGTNCDKNSIVDRLFVENCKIRKEQEMSDAKETAFANALKEISVMEAFCKGKEIECCPRIGKQVWITCENPAWDWSSYVYRVKQEKKYRPWNFGEVPIGAVIRQKNSEKVSLIVSAKVIMEDSEVPGGTLVMVGGAYGGNAVPSQRLFDEWEMVNGNPCGVLK